ncbi:MAG TPA: type II secretion system F family protein [Gemmatimonadaceae bacterium]|nr:type II secretion system F family protein [Gemmatimonadaceae bacterium]
MTATTRFAYRAARADGAFEHGVLAAESRDAALRALAAQGLWAVDLNAARSDDELRTRLSIADLALGLRVLATLLEGGLPVSKALAAMPELAPDAWAPALPGLARGVREGASLGAALERSGLAIPAVVLGIVRAGEAGSGLAQAVRRSADLMEETATTRSAIRAALVYPCILAVAGTISVGILVGVVLPRFAAILADLGQTLPPTTRFVLQASVIARVAALPAGVATLIVLVAWRAWASTEAGATRWHSMLLQVPVLGKIRRSAATARVCAALSALLESGVPLPNALTHAARASGDAAIQERVLSARTSVVAGARPSAAFLTEDALTSVASRLVRAGEETGALAAMLAHAARLENERATQRVRAAVRLLEPALILAFGGLVALVAAALLQAIYSVRPT